MPARAKPAASHLAFVPLVAVHNLMKLVHHVGIEKNLTEMAEKIEADSRADPTLTRPPSPNSGKL